AIAEPEPVPHRRDERRQRVGSNHDLIVRLQPDIGLTTIEDGIQVYAGPDFLVRADAANNVRALGDGDRIQTAAGDDRLLQRDLAPGQAVHAAPRYVPAQVVLARDRRRDHD